LKNFKTSQVAEEKLIPSDFPEKKQSSGKNFSIENPRHQGSFSSKPGMLFLSFFVFFRIF
jgi:hypothetical protein